MVKKVIIGVLAFLIVVIGALGVYSFYLNKEIVALTELQKETGRQIMGLHSSINTLGQDIASQIEQAGKKTASQIEEAREQTTSQIEDLDNRIGVLSTEAAGIPSIDVKRLNEEIKPGVVEVVTEITGTTGATSSGFIFDPQGYIITAYHVVEEATRIEVILYDGTISQASIVGYCPYSDVAVLRLHRPRNIYALTLGDSDNVAIGNPVIAIGHPFNLRGTVTSGIVSQRDRYVNVKDYTGKTRWVPNLIQCDVAINFGNSGGPLVNSRGEVIGLTTARIDPKEGEGIYYFVSSNKFKRVAQSIIEHGYFDYPWLGVEITDLTPGEARARNLDTTNGILVGGVFAKSPASLAGVSVDDIIVAMDGIPLRNVADLTSYLGEHKSPDETTILRVIRDGERVEIPVKLGKRTP